MLCSRLVRYGNLTARQPGQASSHRCRSKVQGAPWERQAVAPVRERHPAQRGPAHTAGQRTHLGRSWLLCVLCVEGCEQLPVLRRRIAPATAIGGRQRGLGCFVQPSSSNKASSSAQPSPWIPRPAAHHPATDTNERKCAERCRTELGTEDSQHVDAVQSKVGWAMQSDNAG